MPGPSLDLRDMEFMSMTGSVFFFAGVIALMVGAEVVVGGASRLAALLGIKPLVIGLTIVAVGTSVPELAVGVIASQQGSGSLAVGNIAGTNMFNILFILGLTCLVSPVGLSVERQLLLFDIPLMTCLALACVPVFLTGKRISRIEGGMGVAIYLIYMLWLIHFRV